MKNIGNMSFINISSALMSSENDFFRELYSESTLKHVTVAIFFFGSIFGILLELGLIWYEKHGNNRYRTVINQLFSFVSWLVVAYITFVYIPEGVRYMIGPLSETFCDAHNLLKNTLSISLILTLDLIVAHRYISIFKFSNFAVINHDMLVTFFRITILVVSLWMAILKRLSVGRMPLNYFMCSGKDPLQREGKLISDVTKVDTFGIVVIISILVNVFALTKIYIYERNMSKEMQNSSIHPNNDSGHDNQAQKQDEPKRISNIPRSMIDLTTQVLFVLYNIINVIIIVEMNKIEPSKLNEFENRWLAYFIQIIGVALGVVGTAMHYYIKNFSAMKNFLFE